MFVLTQNNPHYSTNKKFADQLSQEIQKYSDIKVDFQLYKNGTIYFNQDLSNSSALIEVGDDNSTDSDVNECINALSTALKNIQSNLSKSNSLFLS